MKFVCLTEHNDNEGETWRFWLQYDGNEKNLEELDILLNTFDADFVDEAYELNIKQLVPDTEVDTLVKHSDSGYMNYENKITGTMKTPVFDDADDLYEKLYKGGIKDFFKG